MNSVEQFVVKYAHALCIVIVAIIVIVAFYFPIVSMILVGMLICTPPKYDPFIQAKAKRSK